MHRPSAIFLAILVFSAFALWGQSAEEILRKRFLEEPFVEGKSKIALELAALKTKASREALLGFLDSGDSWDEAGAFTGLFWLNDPELDARLAKRYLDDAGMRSFVSKTFASKPERFLPYFMRTFLSPDPAAPRADILQTAGLGSGKGTEGFLLSVIKDASSEWREEAFLAYSSLRRTQDLSLARSLAADPALKDHALARLSVIGNQDDLAILEKEFYADPRPQIRLPALKAIAAWGRPPIEAARLRPGARWRRALGRRIGIRRLRGSSFRRSHAAGRKDSRFG